VDCWENLLDHRPVTRHLLHHPTNNNEEEVPPVN
jgi:hypothetical protein